MPMFRKAAAFAAVSVLASPISTLETFCANPESVGDDICTRSTSDTDTNGLSLLQKTVRMTRSDNVVSADTTTTTVLVITKNTTASQAAGVSQNAAGDLSAFLSAIVTNVVTVMVCTSIAAYLRLKFPWSYQGNLETGAVVVAEAPEQTFMGWAHASMGLKRDEVIKNVGLDHWLLLEFTHLSMKILGVLAIPNLLILGPCHMFLGGNRAGDDRLSYLGMANVVDGSNLYWIHSVVVWISVWVVQHHIYAAMHEFMHLRIDWLKEMPDPRSQTILVENIQEENRSDAKLAEYFESMLRGEDAKGEKIVESAYVIKDTSKTLLVTKQKHEEICERLDEAKAQKEQNEGESPMIHPEGQMWGDKVDAITYYEGKLTELEEESERERTKILDIVKTGELDEVYTGNGFVTFKHRRDCEISMQLKYTPDEDTLVVSVPPDPSDVVYTDLMVDETREAASETIGWACIAGLFFGYMPIIIGISSVASLKTLSAHIALFRMIVDHHPGIAAVWDGLVGAMALTLMVSFLPTFLVLIFDAFFALKARAWLQHKVQIWYYYFNLVFILLVTAVGSSLLTTVDSLIEDPTSVFKLLATTLPTASHFYLNLYPAQWTTQSMEFMRYVPLTKWIAFNRMLGEGSEAKAHSKAEPEDQDYYGKGSRSARFTIFLVIATTFCTLSPLMLALAFVHFALCRLWYGWMFVFAEIPKADLGGAFWHSKLKHVQQGMFIYIVLMAGVLYYRGTDEKTGEGPGSTPGFIAGASLLYMYKSYTRFDRHFHWEMLPFEDIRDDGSHHKRKPRRNTYQQPELETVLKRKE